MNVPDYTANCFLCGTQNPRGLHLQERAQDGKHTMRLRVEPELCGPRGQLHCGIVTGLMDEMMCYAVLGLDIPVVTIRLDAQYLVPALPGHTVEAEGVVVADEGKNVRTAATLRELDTGTLLARADGVFRKVDFAAILPQKPEEQACTRKGDETDER